MSRLNELVSNLDRAKVLIIGDLMLDKFIQGAAERISPEAPVPVVSVTGERYFLGGAANTARNVSAYGGDVSVVGVIGEDEDSSLFQSLLSESKIKSKLIALNDRPTTRKVRIISQGQQLIRFDYEENKPLSEREYQSLKENISELAKNYDVIIVSDYAKGLINQNVFDHITSLGKKVIVDPKPRKDVVYRGSYLVTPNSKEAEALTGQKPEINTYEETARSISKITGGHVLLTLSENGMYLLADGKTTHLKSESAKVYDVTGAGDTVISTLAAVLSIGGSLEEAAKIANYAAAIVVSKPGTAVASAKEIQELIEELKVREKYDNR